MIINRVLIHLSPLSAITWIECSFKMGKHAHIAHEIHLSLEEKRCEADRNCCKGPVVLIVGPMDAGKSTLTRMLLNYAALSGRKPLYVDLDVGQSSISIPGTIGILPVDKPEDIAAGSIAESSCCVYNFGYKSPSFNMLLYHHLINKLGETVNWRMKSANEIASSGAIIDTCGWVTGGGYESILVAAKSFEINLLLVLSDKSVSRKLSNDLPDDIDVRFIPKICGVVDRSRLERKNRREASVYEYFYGSQNVPLKPHTFEVTFSDLRIYQVVLSNSRRSLSLRPVSITPELQNSVLALSYADKEDGVISSSVFGFICVRQVDMEQQTVTVLSPKSKPLPTSLLIQGDVKFEDNKS